MSSTRTKIVIGVLVSPLVIFGIGSALALDSNSDTKTVPIDPPSVTRTVPIEPPSVARVDTPDSPSYIAGKSWADLGAEEFASLPVGTQIVDCFSTQPRMPPDAMFESGPGVATNPGLHFLIDGRCAFDPSVTGKPIRNDSVDGTSTKAMVEWTPVPTVALSSLPTDTRIVNCWGDIKELPAGVRLQVGNDFYNENPAFHFLTDGRCATSPGASSASVETVTKPYDLQWFGTGLAGTPSVGSYTCFVGDPTNNHCGVGTNVISPGMMSTGGPLPPIPSAK